MAIGTAGALFALSAVSAVSQISQGYAQKAENKYNATLLEGQANMIDAQSEIEQGQYQRLKGTYMSKSVASVAGSGIGLSGSAMAVITETQRQIGIDQAISKFNYAQDKNYTLAQAGAQRRAGKNAVRAGYSGAFSSLLQGASNYAMYRSGPTSNVRNVRNSTSFDFSTQQPLVANGGVLRQPNYRSF